MNNKEFNAVDSLLIAFLILLILTLGVWAKYQPIDPFESNIVEEQNNEN